MKLCIISMSVLLALGGSLSAGLITFSDLDPGLPLGQFGPISSGYSTELPPGVTGTWTNWGWMNQNNFDDHTVSPDDRMVGYLNAHSGSVIFSEPVIVTELFMYKTAWGDVGDWTVRGLLGGDEKWSATIRSDSAWIGVQDGVGKPIDELLFPQESRWNRVDDIAVTIPEPTGLTVVLLGAAVLLRRRR